jgi:hypothetical protein
MEPLILKIFGQLGDLFFLVNLSLIFFLLGHQLPFLLGPEKLVFSLDLLSEALLL